MMIHILTHDIESYLKTILFVLILGSFQISRHIHIRWFKNSLSIVSTNAFIKTIFVCIGFLFIPFYSLFTYDYKNELLAIVIGVLFGLLVTKYETYTINRRNRRNSFLQKITVGQGIEFTSSVVIKNLKLNSAPKIKRKGLKIRDNFLEYSQLPNLTSYCFLSIVTVAIMEEFLFRGFLFYYKIFCTNQIEFLLLIFISVFTFTFAHVISSWTDFIRKIPLSFFTTIGFLITGSLLAPIITHLVLNIFAYSKTT